MFKKLVKYYKDNFVLETIEDKEFIYFKKLKYRRSVLLAVIVFDILLSFITIKTRDPATARYWEALEYYGVMAAITLVGLVFAWIHKKNKKARMFEIVLGHLMVVGYLSLCVWIITCNPINYYPYFFVSIFVVFVFDLQPLIWCIMNIVAAVTLAFLELNGTETSIGIFANYCLFTALAIVLGFWKRRRLIKDLRQQRELIKANKESEALLLNILPEKVMKDLKETGKTTPQLYKNVTVLFTDIVNFTEQSKDMDPRVVIEELNEIFGEFDRIVDKNHCTRIKTIGDAYLAVCGLPEADENHAENIVNCAREFIGYLEERNKTAPYKWNIRAGVHTGEVVAGIVGIHKYIYDIFGDTVNTASRVQNCGSAMKINVSQEVYEMLKDKGVKFTPREIMEVKGKGKMQMYFAN